MSSADDDSEEGERLSHVPRTYMPSRSTRRNRGVSGLASSTYRIAKFYLPSFVEVPGSVESPSAILLPIPDDIPPNNAHGPGDQPWAMRIVEVPGIEPGSAQIQSGLLRA